MWCSIVGDKGHVLLRNFLLQSRILFGAFFVPFELVVNLCMLHHCCCPKLQCLLHCFICSASSDNLDIRFTPFKDAPNHLYTSVYLMR